MNLRLLSTTLLLLATATAATAAPPRFVTVDHSTATLMDAATAKALWDESIPQARLAKLYPPARWGFISEVEGGFTDGRACVVTARAMIVPRTGKSFVWNPAKMATTFDTLPSATQGQCRDLAKTKLREAIQSLMSSFMKT